MLISSAERLGMREAAKASRCARVCCSNSEPAAAGAANLDDLLVTMHGGHLLRRLALFVANGPAPTFSCFAAERRIDMLASLTEWQAFDRHLEEKGGHGAWSEHGRLHAPPDLAIESGAEEVV